MMKRLVLFFTRICERFLPDAFVFCLFLTLFVYVAALILSPYSGLELIDFWGKDFWSLNSFAMQMVFVLLSGHMLASTNFIRKVLEFLTGIPKNEFQALILLSVFSIMACFINWGFGLIVSGILAVEMARKLKRVNFALFVATAYAGFLVWHGGLSGSIPLKIATSDEVLHKIFPGLRIQLAQTIFSSWNLVTIGIILLIFPFLSVLMNDHSSIEVSSPSSTNDLRSKNDSFRDQLENSAWPNRLIFIFFGIYLMRSFSRGEALDINKVNWIFLFLAIFLHGTPANFLRAVQSSINYVSGIVIQFPFYAGLMGLMQYSGLADQISQLFIQIATKDTLPLWTFLSGGIVNFFIPSGGGQWVVQGPVMLRAAQNLGSDPAKISMALAWGDAWTNLIQPFWALPILALAKLQIKDIMGYCLIYTLVSGILISGMLLFF
jgi:short-chain fatty acids transporter